MKELNGKADAQRLLTAAAISCQKGMKLLLLVITVMAFTITVVLISTDGLGLFCANQRSSSLYKEFLITYTRTGDLEEEIGEGIGFYSDNLEKKTDAGIALYSNDLEKKIRAVNLENNIGEGVGFYPDDLEKKAGAGCDYSVGKWVKDENKPLYSGDTCKQWLSEMWACRLMPNRPNFDFENYRWQSHGCDLPAFNAQNFLSRMKNKVLAFIGDSLGRQQHQSFMCMLTGGKDDALIEDVNYLYGLVKPRGTMRADGTAQMFKETNTTIIYYWSATLCEITPLNKRDPDTEFAMHLDRPATFLQKYLDKMDILILNTGHHWNRGKMAANKWVMHANGKKIIDKKYRQMSAARNFTIHKIIAWLDEQVASNHTRAEIYLRTLSPRHFFNGEWDSGGRCDNDLVPIEKRNITGRMIVDPVAESAVMGTRVHLLNVTYLSQFRDEAHISRYRPKQTGQDCLHWCLPGLPDIWNELLYAELFFGKSPLRKS